MKRFGEILCVAVVFLLLVAVSPAQGQTTQTLFISGTMSAANEVPPVALNASGTFTALFTVNRDAAGAITGGSAQVDASFNLPAGTTIVAGHFHEAAAGVNGPVRINFGVAPTTFAAGTGTISSFVPTIAADVLTRLVNNPAGFYINYHSTANPGGVVRGQLSTLANTNVGSNTCQTICFRSPAYYVHIFRGGFPGLSGGNAIFLPFVLGRDGVILIGGFNWNQPVSITTLRGLLAAFDALTGGAGFGSFNSNAAGPLARLNQQFVAFQLSWIIHTDAVIDAGVRASKLRCYGITSSVTLSNNFAITPDSPVNDLFVQAEAAIRANRLADMAALAAFFSLLNIDDPIGL